MNDNLRIGSPPSYCHNTCLFQKIGAFNGVYELKVSHVRFRYLHNPYVININETTSFCVDIYVLQQ